MTGSSCGSATTRTARNRDWPFVRSPGFGSVALGPGSSLRSVM